MAPPFPNFVIIGSERAGARWLRFNLDRHPDVFAPPGQVDFFADPDKMHRRGSLWYRQRFHDWTGETAIGECSPHYLSDQDLAAGSAMRMQKALPDVRLIAIVRDPVDRLCSMTRVRQLRGQLPPGDELPGLAEHIFAERGADGLRFELMQPARVGRSLMAFAELFSDQLLLLLYDDLCRDPAGVYAAALAHLGVDTGVVPDDLARVRYRGPRGEGFVAPATSEVRGEVVELYGPDVDVIEELTGRDLSAWRSTDLPLAPAGI